MGNLAVAAARSSDGRRIRALSVTLALIGYLAPIVTCVAHEILFALLSRGLPGVVVYYEIAFGLLCISLAALVSGFPWWTKILLAVVGSGLFATEILVIGFLYIALTGLEGIQ